MITQLQITGMGREQAFVQNAQMAALNIQRSYNPQSFKRRSGCSWPVAAGRDLI